jgi:NAD(P)-dependent dehydrogenase (short-subunit alcohol dehydrogenase family)
MSLEEMFSVKGHGAIVTGGASGIGFAISEVLAEQGAVVTIIDRNVEVLDAAVDALKGRGLDVRGAAVDVRDPAAMRAAFDAAHDAAGRLDITFANAGIGAGAGFIDRKGVLTPGNEIENYDLDRWDSSFEVNLKGAFIAIQNAARLMKPRKSGRIIVTSSVTAVMASPVVGISYPVSKAAVAHLVRIAAIELVNYGILVNAIAPGAFATPIGGGGMMDPAVEAVLGPSIPIGRFARPNEMKGLALYLASPACSYMVGSQLLYDGGLALGRLPRPE